MKTKIYIDFEAITFNYLTPLNYVYFKELQDQKLDLPFCYTLGVVNSKNKLKTVSQTFDLKPIAKFKPFDVFWTKAKTLFLKDLRILLHTKNLDFNQIEFYSWNNSLESKLLTKFFNVESNDLSKGRSISLDKLVPLNEFEDDNFQTIINMQANKLTKRIKFQDNDSKGKIAACLGALIIACQNSFYARNLKISKPLTQKQIDDILAVILAYNKNDVLKLHYVDMHSQQTTEIINKITKLNHNKSKIINEINKLSSWIKDLEIAHTEYKISYNMNLQQLMEYLNKAIQNLETHNFNPKQPSNQHKFYNKLLLLVVRRGKFDLYIKNLDAKLNTLKQNLLHAINLLNQKLELAKQEIEQTPQKIIRKNQAK